MPLEPILRHNRKQAARELDILIESRSITHLVVGLPSGSATQFIESNEMTRRIKHFVSLLEFEGEIIYVNEDFTSFEAFEDTLHMKKQSRAKAQKNGQLDSYSACKILKIYLQNERL